MQILVVAAHPVPESYNNAVRDQVVATLTRLGHTVDLINLNADGFDPVMSAQERRDYHTAGLKERPVADYLARLTAADALVFVYPTWWYGLPAILKGWLDRVFVPHVTFAMPEPGKSIRPRLTRIRAIAAVSTSGSPWWFLELALSNPGRRTLLRGIRAICSSRCRTLWTCHYRMDHSTDGSRRRYLAKVDRKLARFFASP